MGPGKAAARGAQPLPVEREMARARAWAFEPFTLFRVPPLAGRYVNVSAAGFRHGRRGTRWPPDPQATNVFVFGGSTAFGFEVADDETIPSQLADRLAALYSDADVAVYNFASPNYASVQERIRLEQLLVDGHVPRLAIFVDGFDEFLWPYYAPMMLAPFAAAIPRPSSRQLVATALRAAARSVLGRVPGAATAPRATTPHQTPPLPDPVRVLDRYLANKRLIQGGCERFGVQPLFVWQPVPCYRYEGAGQLPQLADAAANQTRDALLAGIRAGYELMSARRDEAARDEDLWLADLQVGRSDALYADFDHYTAAFCGEIAAAIAAHIAERGLLRGQPVGVAGLPRDDRPGRAGS